MAQRSGLSRSTIGRIWRRFDLKPHRAETFKLSTDPLFVLYFNPPDGAVVLCADEKSQIQANPACLSDVPTTTYATASPPCSPRSTPAPVR